MSDRTDRSEDRSQGPRADDEGSLPKGTALTRFFRRGVVAKKARIYRARREGDRGIWFALGMFGLVGWSIATPILLGAWLGLWLDARFQSGTRWTLSLIFAGLLIGAVSVWHWIERQRRSTQAAEDETEEEGDGES